MRNSFSPGSPSRLGTPASGVSSRPSTGRYNLRRHSPAESASTRKASVAASISAAPKRKKPTPFDLLVKEKLAKDKSGKGTDALRAAEASLQAPAMSSSDFLKDIFKNEPDEDGADAWNDEDAARRIAYGSSPGVDDALDGDENDEDAMQVLEHTDLKDGKAVGILLAKDKKLKAGQSRKGKPVGIALWIAVNSSETLDTDDEMSVDRLLPLRFDEADIGQNALLSTLQASVNEAGT